MNKTVILAGAGLGLVLILGAAWAARGAGRALASGLNPVSPENFFYEGAGGVVSVLTGREETLGGWLAGIFNPATREVDRLYGPTWER